MDLMVMRACMHCMLHAQMLAGLPVTPSEVSKHEERLAALLPISITAASVLANARLLRKPNMRAQFSAVQAFRTGSSTDNAGSGGDLSALPVAHAGSVPFEADMRR